MSTDHKYWKGLEELRNDLDFVKNAEREFPDAPADAQQPPQNPDEGGGGNNLDNLSTHRRDFLKLMGFSVAAASLAACETPVRKAIPYLNKPEEVFPGVANYYASTWFEAGEYASILVKTREGRPIKVEGNKASSVTGGGTSAKTQASVLSLYDTYRYESFKKGDQAIKQEQADQEIQQKLAAANAAGQAIYLVTGTIISPTTKRVIEDFKAQYPSTKHVQYDAHSVAGLLDANQQMFGERSIPDYQFDKAKTVLSIGADFLGTWISPVRFARKWAKSRKLNSKKEKDMSQLHVLESNFSLTGANADYRSTFQAGEDGKYAGALYNAVAQRTGNRQLGEFRVRKSDFVERAAEKLVANQGASIVVGGSNDPQVQLLINGINKMLGNYGKTLRWDSALLTKQGDDKAFEQFANSVGNAGAVMFYGCNPVYDSPYGQKIKEGLKNAKLTVSFSDRPDESAEGCTYKCPSPHYLECWGDAQPQKGFYSLTQPTIQPLFDTRQFEASLLKWAAKNSDYYTYLKKNWKESLYPKNQWYKSFNQFWNYSLHDGVFEVSVKPNRDLNKLGSTPQPNDSITADSPSSDAPSEAASDSLQQQMDEAAAQVDEAVAEATNAVNETLGDTPAANADTTATSQPQSVDFQSVGSTVLQRYKKADNLVLEVYESVGLGVGSSANNPWLQELPDPMTKATWDNYCILSIKDAKALGVKDGDMMKVSANGNSVQLPAIVLPGQAHSTVGIAMGYGRSVCGKVGQEVGVNAFQLISFENGYQSLVNGKVNVEKGEGFKQVARTQTHETIMTRPVVQETTLPEYQKDSGAGKYHPHVTLPSGEKVPAPDINMWEGHQHPNHQWGMLIDLNSCIGCSACLVACNAENNVPVVGRQEVINRREMHWIRIDRYFSAKPEVEGYFDEYGRKELEDPAEFPDVVFQPMMCQHCNNAPCETVCPVAATQHSTEGLNAMAYNRCIGTRYCANNCPYKVRRFNWFSYIYNDKYDEVNPQMEDPLTKMVLNPDVTVRSRGVMEKCSMCVQRIQDGKLTAKKEGRRPADGEIKTACASACPTDSIIFGDRNDPNSRISQRINEEDEGRRFVVLEELNTDPSVSYLTKVRNIEPEAKPADSEKTENA